MEKVVSDAGGNLIDAIASAVADKLEHMAVNEQRLLDIDQAAKYLGMSPAALRQKVSAGQVVVVRLDAKLRFDRRDLDRYISQAPREGV